MHLFELGKQKSPCLETTRLVFFFKKKTCDSITVWFNSPGTVSLTKQVFMMDKPEPTALSAAVQVILHKHSNWVGQLSVDVGWCDLFRPATLTMTNHCNRSIFYFIFPIINPTITLQYLLLPCYPFGCLFVVVLWFSSPGFCHTVLLVVSFPAPPPAPAQPADPSGGAAAGIWASHSPPAGFPAPDLHKRPRRGHPRRLVRPGERRFQRWEAESAPPGRLNVQPCSAPSLNDHWWHPARIREK